MLLFSLPRLAEDSYVEINGPNCMYTTELPKAVNVCGLYQSVPQSPQRTCEPKDSPKAALRPPLSTKTELIRKLIASPGGMGLQTLFYTPC